MTRPEGIPGNDLSDEDLNRELRHLYETRADTFFDGSQDALSRHTERMMELEAEWAKRNGREPDADRTREGARARAGQPT